MERPTTGWPMARVLARDWIFAGYPIAHWQHHDAEARPTWRAVVFVSLFTFRQFQLACIYFSWDLDTNLYNWTTQ